MYLLFPGRHHLLTSKQFDFLAQVLLKASIGLQDVDGQPLGSNISIDGIVFAITSANHTNTRRNPIPFYLRAMALQEFASKLSVPFYIYGIDDIGNHPGFASYTLKRIKHESEGLLDLTPDNTIVVCSTPVLLLYQQLGFRILAPELENKKTWSYNAHLPWELVENIAANDRWAEDPSLISQVHPASVELFKKYRLDAKIRMLVRDLMISDDGDITTTRDYNTYVRQMDDIAELKYSETASYIRPGRIGDIGCAVGSWIKLASKDERFHESDFYGIEVARHLFDICTQRKHNGEFANPSVFFAQRNAVTGLVYEPNSMNTIHTSSLTHEIESYGSREDLLHFIQNRYHELANGGVWINRDVVGPFDKKKTVLMKVNRTDGRNTDTEKIFTEREQLRDYLKGLSTYGKFLRFASDFRKKEGYKLDYKEVNINGVDYIQLTLSDACEFMSRKDYLDNWQSEMHETFCFWDFNEWTKAVEAVGFRVLTESKPYTNDWIVENRLKGKVELFALTDAGPYQLPYPNTNMVLLAEKR